MNALTNSRLRIHLLHHQCWKYLSSNAPTLPVGLEPNGGISDSVGGGDSAHALGSGLEDFLDLVPIRKLPPNLAPNGILVLLGALVPDVFAIF